MISLELSKKLKNAGLRWEPKAGDWWHGDRGLKLYDNKTKHRWNEWNKTRKHLIWTHRGIVWLPSLSQLLAEIERRGYKWSLYSDHGNEYGMILTAKYNPDKSEIVVFAYGEHFDEELSPEEAAGQALLWIMEQEVSQ